ncbi:ROK family transcriptional regulator [Zhihengliuella halotolerans]|uniref:Putative NBD/HSP70 family sugar kinase n=1 Tax=Zhihengliuella halotolerans TaxID=370736 RepID=A0A4Q8AAR4_9MICC|nr:ROK family transcriptional regulator [Zhihengliuella halotolerans]RZU60613.1 putative NBD/HSP70 family sugar kinase [Zhihengliuella halotolerans]
MQRGTNLGRLGDFNQAVIFDSIRRAEDGISRVELATSTGLSPQTISNVVRRLLDNGFVREDRTVISGPGKPRTVLELEADRLFAIGIHLDPGQITVVMVNLRGRVVGSRRFVERDIAVPEETISMMATAVEELIKDSGQPKDHIVGIGVAAPGPINPESGTIVSPPLMNGWNEVEVVEPLVERLSLDVLIEKDSVASAIAEQWNGDEARDRNFMSVYIGTGVGVGMVIGGEVIRGASSNAGEIARVRVNVDGSDADRAESSTFATAVSFPSVLTKARELGVDVGAVTEEATMHERSQFLNTIVRQAKGGDEASVALIKVLNGYWASLVSQLTNTFDVDKVFVGGPVWAELHELLHEDMDRILQERFLMKDVHELDVRTSELGHNLGAIGGACAVLDAALSPKASALLLR